MMIGMSILATCALAKLAEAGAQIVNDFLKSSNSPDSSTTETPSKTASSKENTDSSTAAVFDYSKYYRHKVET